MTCSKVCSYLFLSVLVRFYNSAILKLSNYLKINIFQFLTRIRLKQFEKMNKFSTQNRTLQEFKLNTTLLPVCCMNQSWVLLKVRYSLLTWLNVFDEIINVCHGDFIEWSFLFLATIRKEQKRCKNHSDYRHFEIFRKIPWWTRCVYLQKSYFSRIRWSMQLLKVCKESIITTVLKRLIGKKCFLIFEIKLVLSRSETW